MSLIYSVTTRVHLRECCAMCCVIAPTKRGPLAQTFNLKLWLLFMFLAGMHWTMCAGRQVTLKLPARGDAHSKVHTPCSLCVLQTCTTLRSWYFACFLIHTYVHSIMQRKQFIQSVVDTCNGLCSLFVMSYILHICTHTYTIHSLEHTIGTCVGTLKEQRKLVRKE